MSVAGVDRSRYKGAWYKAMETEMHGLVDSNTFTVLDKLPEGEKAIGSRWVLSVRLVFSIMTVSCRFGLSA